MENRMPDEYPAKAGVLKPELILVRDRMGRVYRISKDELCGNAGIRSDGRCAGYPENFIDSGMPCAMCENCEKNQFYKYRNKGNTDGTS